MVVDEVVVVGFVGDFGVGGVGCGVNGYDGVFWMNVWCCWMVWVGFFSVRGMLGFGWFGVGCGGV